MFEIKDKVALITGASATKSPAPCMLRAQPSP